MWDAFRGLWEAEASAAGHLTKEEVASLYKETMERWLRFNEEERELADAIREDAFYGITAHIPAEYRGTDY